MAYNLLAIARTVHLRRDKLISWQRLRDWLCDAIVWSSILSVQLDEEASAADP